MKKKLTDDQAAEAPPPAAPPIAAESPINTPVFDYQFAQSIEPYRHEPSARTVAYHQADGIETHLFSATRKFIGTVKTADLAPPPLPAAETPTQE